MHFLNVADKKNFSVDININHKNRKPVKYLYKFNFDCS